MEAATAYADELARIGAQQTAVARSSTRIHAAVNRVEGSSEVKNALTSMAWEVTCDIVSGALPDDRDDIESWLLNNAIRFGIEFLGEAEAQFAEGLLNVVFSNEEKNEAAEACKKIPDSGL